MTIKELLELAWQKPISKITKEYGITYQDFKELCSDNQIPLLENGYWSKLKFGRPVTKTELPIGIDTNKKLD